jgi:hypothetical protein
MTEDLVIALSLRGHAPSIEAEQEHMEEYGSLVYALPTRPTRAKPGSWVYYIRQGQLQARARVLQFEELDHPETFYSYTGRGYVHRHWQVRLTDLELAPVRLPVAWRQKGYRYVTEAEADRFARAFDPTLDHLAATLPEEIVAPERVIEGAQRRITVNAYERDRRARHICLVYHGTRCVCCTLDMGARYGPVAEGLIHVHHLVPLSTIRQAYVLNPVADLRPVCPNCHAVIHLKDPPYRVDEVRLMLRMSESTTGSGLGRGRAQPTLIKAPLGDARSGKAD